MDNAGFGERVYSAAKMAAVVDALLECGVPADEALDGCDVSFDQLHSPRTKISRNQLIRCYRNAIALSRDPHLPFTIGSKRSSVGLRHVRLCNAVQHRLQKDDGLRHPVPSTGDAACRHFV